MALHRVYDIIEKSRLIIYNGEQSNVLMERILFYMVFSCKSIFFRVQFVLFFNHSFATFFHPSIVFCVRDNERLLSSSLSPSLP